MNGSRRKDRLKSFTRRRWCHDGAEPKAGATSAWQDFPHDADIGVRGLGATREAAFEQAALALTAVVEAAGRAGLAGKVARLRPLVCIKG